jgi:hypothetical protein
VNRRAELLVGRPSRCGRSAPGIVCIAIRHIGEVGGGKSASGRNVRDARCRPTARDRTAGIPATAAVIRCCLRGGLRCARARRVRGTRVRVGPVAGRIPVRVGRSLRRSRSGLRNRRRRMRLAGRPRGRRKRDREQHAPAELECATDIHRAEPGPERSTGSGRRVPCRRRCPLLGGMSTIAARCPSRYTPR